MSITIANQRCHDPTRYAHALQHADMDSCCDVVRGLAHEQSGSCHYRCNICQISWVVLPLQLAYPFDQKKV